MFNGYFDVVLADQDLTVPPSWRERAWTSAARFSRHGIPLAVVLVAGLALVGSRLATVASRR